MESSKIDLFLLVNAKYFPSEKMPIIRQQLEKVDDAKFNLIIAIAYKDPTTILLASLFAGNIGIDRFLLGEVGLGVAKLLTCGGAGIWTIVDWFTAMNRARDINFDSLQEILMVA